MNIGQLMRSLISEAQPGDAKTLELKVGQIVKGMVLQLLADQDALINIGGVQMKAHLEIPLKQGQVTLLQVQPESANGQIVFKPLANSTVEIADESIGDVLKNMGLKDNPTNRQIIQTLHQENIPLSPDKVQSFVKVLAQIPANVQPENWQQAALLASKRGLPITTETVSSLHQVLNGSPIETKLDQLSQQISDTLNHTSQSNPVHETLIQVKQFLVDLQGLASQAFKDVEEGTEMNNKSTQATTSDRMVNPTSDKLDPNANILNRTLPDPPSAAVTGTTTNQPIIGDKGKLGTPINNNLLENTIKANAVNENLPQINKAAKQAGLNETLSSPLASTDAPAIQTAKSDQVQWISKWLKSLGVEHEQQLFKVLDKASGLDKIFHKPSESLTAQLTAASPTSEEANEVVKQTIADTLKAALLQLNAMDDTPSAIKESSEQLLQQITGQQLLLSSDRSAMFTHITLMIPMNNAAGEQTAAVHIQSQKGSRGEIDANNCRLLFDLRMKSIGDTLVDVQVYNRIVSLQVHNDHDFVSSLLEKSRDEIASSLHNIGYQFLSLKCTPFPSDANDSSAPTQDSSKNGNATHYVSKPYKGVDIRV